MPSEPMRALDDLVTLRAEKHAGVKSADVPYVGLEHMTSGEPFLLGTARSDTSISTNSVFRRGDILFGKLRPLLRKSLRAPFDGYCSTDILVLEPAAGFDGGFAARVFQRDEVFAEAVRTSAGTKMPRTSWARLRHFGVYAPADNDEQRRIAEILDTADEAIQKTEALIAKLKAMKAGLHHDLLTRGLDPHGRLRDPAAHPEQFKDSPLGRIPAEWDVSTLGGACALLKDGTHLPPKRVTEGPLLLSVQNMDNGTLVATDVDTRVPWSFYSEMHRTWEVAEGDVLLAIVGATLGKTAIVPKMPKFTLQRSVAVLRGKAKVLHNGFLYCYITSVSCQRALWRGANQTAQPGTYLADLARLVIPLPQWEEQLAVVERLGMEGDRIRSEEAYLAKLKAIKKGLMHDLLTGRVRVASGITEKGRQA